MSQAFRALLQKVGSGQHTAEVLTRAEAAEAAELMLTAMATPAQIGAFMIAHRIKRPAPVELAGFLDTYQKRGPMLQAIEAAYPAFVFGVPYDGRSRTAPSQPLVGLLLAALGCPVVLHGGERMPTKYGLPLIESWRALGVDWQGLPLASIQSIFATTRIGFLHLPDHFPLAHRLVDYRDQIGKRPPQATLELVWCPYAGDCQLVVGYVHPPTEALAKETCALRQVHHLLTVKGLEGSPDLPLGRAAIVGKFRDGSEERLVLHAREFGLGDGQEVPLTSEAAYLEMLPETLAGKPTPLTPALVWNGGFYLWQGGVVPSLAIGIQRVQALLKEDCLLQQLAQLQAAIAHQRTLTASP